MLDPLITWTLGPLMAGGMVMLAGGVLSDYSRSDMVASWSKVLAVWSVGAVVLAMMGGIGPML